MQVAGNTSKNVCLAASETLSLHQPLYEIPSSTPGSLVQVRSNTERTVGSKVGKGVWYLGEGGSLELRSRHPGLVLEELKAEGSANRGFDGSAADLTVALGCMTVTTAEEGAGGLNGEEDGGPDAELSTVHVSAGVCGRHGREFFVVGWGETHASEEGTQGDPHVFELGEACLAVQLPDLDLGLWEFVGQQTEAWDDGGPAPVGNLKVQDFDFEDIAGLGIVHIDRTEDGIGQAEIQRLDG